MEVPLAGRAYDRCGSQRIDLELPEQVGPGFTLMSPARRSSNRRCLSGFTTLVTEKTATFLLRSSGCGRHEKALVHAVGWLHSMVLHGRKCYGRQDCHNVDGICPPWFNGDITECKTLVSLSQVNIMATLLLFMILHFFSGFTENSISVPKILLCCTGSVASVKVPQLVKLLSSMPCRPEVKLVTTKSALHFFGLMSVGCQTYTDGNEWELWRELEDPVLHIQLRHWADLLVISPLDANTLAKISNGICDNLLTCVVRSWDVKRPLLFAPAMNTHMWQHAITAQQIGILKSFGYSEIPCVRKKLACGDEGMGAMAEIETIVKEVEVALQVFRSI